ncbi:hypothetical protein BCR33DRAFT_718650 [Rhizoclosmatium globosum]|uniref:GATA-type domain-containing protein n=1 Tax=Rhizoclosmatium globosum TaxID=329046 RepID=A0A1Y2C567_9FUNG|nr:hypothetical protein BCR33DRAFT_718650 [Rhizoclosmatium globosum]|eukprot:ORY42027.1 hypothetical protein BCR33DRAFT_718650 [Rhizoclosmatium globosum]
MLVSLSSEVAPPSQVTSTDALLFLNGDNVGTVTHVSAEGGRVLIQVADKWWTFDSSVRGSRASANEVSLASQTSFATLKNLSSSASNLLLSHLKAPFSLVASFQIRNVDAFAPLKVAPPWPLRPVVQSNLTPNQLDPILRQRRVSVHVGGQVLPSHSSASQASHSMPAVHATTQSHKLALGFSPTPLKPMPQNEEPESLKLESSESLIPSTDALPGSSASSSTLQPSQSRKRPRTLASASASSSAPSTDLLSHPTTHQTDASSVISHPPPSKKKKPSSSKPSYSDTTNQHQQYQSRKKSVSSSSSTSSTDSLAPIPLDSLDSSMYSAPPPSVLPIPLPIPILDIPSLPLPTASSSSSSSASIALKEREKEKEKEEKELKEKDEREREMVRMREALEAREEMERIEKAREEKERHEREERERQERASKERELLERELREKQEKERLEQEKLLKERQRVEEQERRSKEEAQALAKAEAERLAMLETVLSEVVDRAVNEATVKLTAENVPENTVIALEAVNLLEMAGNGQVNEALQLQEPQDVEMGESQQSEAIIAESTPISDIPVAYEAMVVDNVPESSEESQSLLLQTEPLPMNDPPVQVETEAPALQADASIQEPHSYHQSEAITLIEPNQLGEQQQSVIETSSLNHVQQLQQFIHESSTVEPLESTLEEGEMPEPPKPPQVPTTATVPTSSTSARPRRSAGTSRPRSNSIPQSDVSDTDPLKSMTEEGDKKCVTCGATNTPMWRRGPLGAGTLCNACGVKWSKKGAK